MGNSETRQRILRTGKVKRLGGKDRSVSEIGLNERTAVRGNATSVSTTHTSTMSLPSSSQTTATIETQRRTSDQEARNVSFTLEGNDNVLTDQSYPLTPTQYRFSEVKPKKSDNSTTNDVVRRQNDNEGSSSEAHQPDHHYEQCEEQLAQQSPGEHSGDVRNAADNTIAQNFNKVRPKLIEQLDSTTIARAVDELMTLDDGKGPFSGEMWDRVQAQQSEEDKARMLIDILRQQGTGAIKAFANILTFPKIGKSQLAQLLDASIIGNKHQETGINHDADFNDSHSMDTTHSHSMDTTHGHYMDTNRCPMGTASCSESLSEAGSRVSAMKELKRIQQEFGMFSYYSWNESLVIHLKDEKAQINRESLENAVKSVVQRCLNTQERSYSVEVSDIPLDAKLCSPRIGSTLRVQDINQTTGMFLVHHGVVHWVSVAHNFVHAPHEAIHGIPVENLAAAHPSRQVHIDFGDDQLVLHNDAMVMSPRPYYCLRHNPRDHMGREILHTVDIMIGPVPMIAPVNINDHRERYLPLVEVRDRTRLIYRISRILRITPLAGGEDQNYVIYDITKDDNFNKYKNVMTILPGGDIAEGTIMTNFCDVEPGNLNYRNAVLIASFNDTTPAPGDSGSIWVAKDSSEAVAITVGMAKTLHAEKVWIAVLLYPSLEAFCQEHRDTFRSINDFASVDGRVLVDTQLP